MGGSCGNNCRLLDNHKDANKVVLDWFKEYPLVLVDRDRVHSLENQFPKQHRGGYLKLFLNLEVSY